MKKITALLVIVSFFIFNIFYGSWVSAAEIVTEEISSVSKAKEIAEMAKGGYWEGPAAPTLAGNEVALPVIDKTGKVIGHIVADRDKLVSALNATGYAKVASSLASAQAGTAAGLSAGTGISMGTIGIGALGIAAVAGAALALSGGGGGGTTSNH